MAEPWEQIRDTTVAIVKDSLKGFIENSEVDAFIKEKSELYAKEFIISQTASTQAEKDEATANLKHLRAQIKGEALRLRVEISTEAKNTLGRILESVGGMLLDLAPKLIALL